LKCKAKGKIREAEPHGELYAAAKSWDLNNCTGLDPESAQNRTNGLLLGTLDVCDWLAFRNTCTHMHGGVGSGGDLNKGKKKQKNKHDFIAIGMRMRGRKVSEKDTHALKDVCWFRPKSFKGIFEFSTSMHM